MTYKRILLKVSGEAFSNQSSDPFDSNAIDVFVEELMSIIDLDIQVGLVLGGGNFFRGDLISEKYHFSKSQSDQLGMLATGMNALFLKNVLKNYQIKTSLYASIGMPGVFQVFDNDSVLENLEKGEVIIFSGGTGHPFFTTDTAAALRALEIEADLLIKATKVSGVYDKDPLLFSNAKLYDRLSYQSVIENQLKVMDMTSIALCQTHELPIAVLNIFEKGSLRALLLGESVGTLIESSA